MKKPARHDAKPGAESAAPGGKSNGAGVTAKVRQPDFLGNLERLGYSEKVGARMLEKFNDSLS